MKTFILYRIFLPTLPLLALGCHRNGGTFAPDTDGAGLTDIDEETLGTNPENPATDDDGLIDGDEVDLGTDPLMADTDGDGLNDGDEVAGGTDPLTDNSIIPVLGDWLIGKASGTATNTCGTEFVDPEGFYDGTVLNPILTVSSASATEFELSLGEPGWTSTCSNAIGAFSCEDIRIEEVFDFGSVTKLYSFEGTLSSETAGLLSFKLDWSCTGAICDSLHEAGVAAPCTMEGDFGFFHHGM